MSWNMVGKMRMRDCNNATQTHAFTHTHTHRHTWLLWFSFFLNQEVPEWNSWTTLFGRNDGCWSLVRWPYMHLRHWRCCGRRRWWAPPTPHRTSYLVSGLAGGLGRGWLLGGTPSTLQRVGWMWMNVCLWAVCECVCVCLYKKKSRKNCCIRILWQILYVCIFVHESVEKL